MDKIQAKIVIEILGTPKEHVEQTITKVIENLKSEEGVKLLRETTYQAEKIKDMWSTFSDLEIQVNDLTKLVSICFDYMPSSVEIIDPIEMELETVKITDLLNDLMARLHKTDMLLKNSLAENKILKQKK
ncbi:hypothetical protein FJZ53_02270 [Candidatus Woesearchaeota archaeon]|nr:hypothetical protein [Candidatus Woesearchaeota archaeon]